jgi:hypothetical protein
MGSEGGRTMKRPSRKRTPAKAKRVVRKKAPARRRAPARSRRARLASGTLVQAPEGERQLADPVEAAQEDLRALPEQALFDRDGSARDDDLAELLGEEYVRAVTSGEEQGVEMRDASVPEEEGGPFVETSASREFASGPDDAEPEALPTTHRPATRQLR